jgi:hypothetical protein
MNFGNKYTLQPIKKSLPHTKNNVMTTTLSSSFFISRNNSIFKHTQTHTDENKFFTQQKSIAAYFDYL